MSTKRVIFCCGTGGVGKTTVSAATAIRMAQSGISTVVLTIDPSKRLRTSLGITDDAAPGLVELTSRVGTPAPLWARIPDSRRTFEALLRILAPDSAWLERMLHNSLFKTLAGEYSGAHEFLSWVMLHDLAQDDRFDCIVVDTPPSQNAAAFLKAPELMGRILDEQIVQWVSQGVGKTLSVLKSLLGSGFFGSLIEFFQLLHGIQDRLGARLKAIQGLIQRPETKFWLVAGPHPETLHAIETLQDELRGRGLVLQRCILNRTLSHLGTGTHDPSLSPQIMEWFQASLDAEQSVLDRLSFGEISLLPELSRDVHSLEDLAHVAHTLPASIIHTR